MGLTRSRSDHLGAFHSAVYKSLEESGYSPQFVRNLEKLCQTKYRDYYNIMAGSGNTIQKLALAVTKNACGSSRDGLLEAVFQFGAEFSSGTAAVTTVVPPRKSTGLMPPGGVRRTVLSKPVG